MARKMGRWRGPAASRTMQRNQSGTMRNLFVVVGLLFLCDASACIRASFSPDEGQDSGPPDLATGVGDEPVADQICSAPTVTACTSQIATGAPCDPVCQSGTCDWCGQKCTVAGDGTAVCASTGPIPSKGLCTIERGGDVAQHDNCMPGNICLSPDPGSGFSFCFPLCRTRADCAADVACAPRSISPIASASSASVTVSVCDPEYQALRSVVRHSVLQSHLVHGVSDRTALLLGIARSRNSEQPHGVRVHRGNRSPHFVRIVPRVRTRLGVRSKSHLPAGMRAHHGQFVPRWRYLCLLRHPVRVLLAVGFARFGQTWAAAKFVLDLR